MNDRCNRKKRKYQVTITETLQKVVEVKASSESEALSIVKNDYDYERHVLDYSNHTATEFEAEEIPTL
ncbi:MAG: DpnD/PcfM family protein [bacterium]